MRLAISSAVAFTLSLLLVMIPGNLTPAGASTIAGYAPDAPRAVNVLPSVAKAGLSTGITAPASQQALMSYLARSAKSPAFWQAAAAYSAGTATPGQVATITQVQQTYRVPSTAPQKMIKTVGAVGTAMVGLDLGLMMGNGALELFGYDVDGTVCPNTGTDPIGEVTRWVAQADCTAWQFPEGYVPNADAATGIGTATACIPGTQRCVSLEAPLQWESNVSNKRHSICASPGGVYSNVPGGQDWVRVHWLRNDTGSSSFSDQTGYTVNTTWIQIPCSGGPERFRIGAGATTALPPYDITVIGVEVWNSLAPGATSGVVNMEAPLSDPQRTLQCEIFASNGQTYTASSDPYFESQGFVAAPVCPALPPEVYPETIKIDETGPTPSTVFEVDTTPEYQTLVEDWPQCLGGLCVLELWADTTTGYRNCLVEPVLCYEWFENPAKNDVFQCRYGLPGQTTPVPLTQCTIYAPSFTPNAGTQGTRYGHPDTGQPVPGSPGVPGSQTTAPDTSDRQAECFPSGWAALNPVEWVLRPVQCALVWAFVPAPDYVQLKVAPITNDLEGTLPGELMVAASSWEFVAPSMGCGGVSMSMTWLMDDLPPIRMFNACPGDPLEGMAGWAKFFFYIGMTVVCVFGVVRHTSRAIGMSSPGES